jgi:ankyrin repeat protein
LQHNPSLLNSVTFFNRWGWIYTPLKIACQYEDSSIVKILLQYPHLDMNRTYDHGQRRTVLHDANWKITKLLLNANGINVDIEDEYHAIPFESFLKRFDNDRQIKRTKKSHHYGVVRLYLTKYPWVIDHKDSYTGNNLLHTIIRWRHIDLFEEVLPYASNIINDGGIDGITPFHMACDKNFIEVVDILLQNKLVDKNKKDNHGYTALHYACRKHRIDVVKKLLASPEVIKDLLDEKMEPPVQTILKHFDYYGNRISPAHLASLNGALSMFQIMLDAGGEVFTANCSGDTVLDQALFLRNEVIYQYRYRSARQIINASGMQEVIKTLNQIIEMLESCDGKRKRVYDYLRNYWIS